MKTCRYCEKPASVGRKNECNSCHMKRWRHNQKFRRRGDSIDWFEVDTIFALLTRLHAESEALLADTEAMLARANTLVSCWGAP